VIHVDDLSNWVLHWLAMHVNVVDRLGGCTALRHMSITVTRRQVCVDLRHVNVNRLSRWRVAMGCILLLP
jgi:hypothetical protein